MHSTSPTCNRATPMNGSSTAAAASRAMTAAAAGPCSASNARSSRISHRRDSADLREINRFAAGVDDHEQALVTQVGDHQVVQDLPAS